MNEPQLPNITDILFKEFNKDYTQNAHIQAGIDAFFRYSFGYQMAAQNLWKQYDGSAKQANSLVYPLIFLNRHFLELRLKELMGLLNYSKNHQFDFLKGHNLIELWNKYKNLAIEFNINQDASLILSVEKLIREFNNIDPIANARYPIDKNKQPAFQIKHIDLKNFMEIMEKLYHFFDIQADVAYCLKDQTDDYIQIMEEELRSNYY